jgi:hypothetical protein
MKKLMVALALSAVLGVHTFAGPAFAAESEVSVGAPTPGPSAEKMKEGAFVVLPDGNMFYFDGKDFYSVQMDDKKPFAAPKSQKGFFKKHLQLAKQMASGHFSPVLAAKTLGSKVVRFVKASAGEAKKIAKAAAEGVAIVITEGFMLAGLAALLIAL